MGTRDEVLSLTNDELELLLSRGEAIAPEALDDQVYRGTSLGLPRALEALSWKTFAKVFHRDPRSGRLRGWNLRLEQTGIDGPMVPRLRSGRPLAFGHYDVLVAGEPSSRPELSHFRGLLLDYGRGGAARGLLARLRDPLVAVNPGSSELLLGRSYLALRDGARWLPTPSYFVLQRHGPLDAPVPAE